MISEIPQKQWYTNAAIVVVFGVWTAGAKNENRLRHETMPVPWRSGPMWAV